MGWSIMIDSWDSPLVERVPVLRGWMHKMAAFVSRMIWLLFWIVEQGGDFLKVDHPANISHRDGTPGGQMVTERFQVDWDTVLVSSFSTIVIRIDGHGSGFQGTNLLHKVRRRLGKLEESDQLAALRSEPPPEPWARLQEWFGRLTDFLSFSGSFPERTTSTRAELEFTERYEHVFKEDPVFFWLQWPPWLHRHISTV